ncbi:MAG: hypothetical protein ACFFD2_20100 [Promethearchaeota archaeon]
MDRLGELIPYIFILIISVYLDFFVFDPIIQDVVELGLNNELTVNGVTAPAKEFMDPTILSLYNLMWYLISLAGIFGTISGIYYFIKKEVIK